LLGWILEALGFMEKSSKSDSNSQLLSFPMLNPNPIIEADFEGNIVYLNEAATTTFPDLEEYHKIQMLFFDWKQIIKPVTDKKVTDYRNETKMGNNWFITQFFLVPNTKKVRVYFTPINELKITESELEKEKNLLQSVMDGAKNVHLIYLDRNFNFVKVNQAYAQTCGLKPEEMVGKNHFDLYPNKENEEIFRKVRDTGEPISFKDKPFIFPDQQERGITYWDWTLQPIKNAQGKVESLVFSLVETTERKKFQIKLEEYADRMEALAEKRARQLSQSERLAAIGQTAGMVGHDIRNPLQAIVGELYLAKVDLDALPDCQAKKNLRENVASIEENLYYIDKIVADLQDYTKPLKPNKEPVRIEKAIEEALLIVNIPNKLEVSINIEKNFPSFKADFPMLKRALINLIQNAVQAMPNGGALTIKAQTKKDNALISIQDTGEGIPQEAQKQLFTPLFTTKSKGQGFGLAVVKRLIEAQDGEVTYRTQNGKGTTFTLQLPLNKQDFNV
jgi:PAS domain S-box-containing protein